MPGIQSLSPSSGPVGTAVTITGTVFGYSGTVTFNGVSAGSVYNWTNSSVTVVVPSGATTGNVVVASGGYVSNPMPFTVVAAPVISGVSPATGLGGTQIAISGSGFGSVQGSGLVWLGSAPGAVVSWSDTQIVATVASNARSGNVQVVQNTIWSNTVPFTVNTAAISSVTPSAGVPGTVVTIAGSGFGAAQGTGQVWLGTANGVVESWSNSQIVAVVANGATSGNAQVLQGGVMSNAVAFTVDALQIASMSPNSGGPGTQVTFTGSGFGATQGNGVVWLGSTAGQVVSWSDTQIVATVAATAVTGIARVEQSDAWSNAFGFWVLPPGSNGVAQITSRLNAVPARYAAAQIERRRSLSPGGNVPSGSAVRPITLRPDQAPGGNAMTLEPSLLNMSVGDTHTIQALSAAGTSVTGLTWTSSNPNVVSLSTDDPPVLTALAAGHVTIIAGAAPNAASADVTVWVGALPLGTVIWSNPGDGSGVSWIVPAVPSTTGVADVFAIQNDGTVQAITSDGTTAWAANISQNQASYYWGPGYVLPDFQGGLVVVGNYDPDTGAASVWKLDGITGQPYPAYTAPGYGADGGGTILCPGAEGWVGGACAAVHPDGTIFAVQENVAVSYDPNLPITRTYSLIGIDPATGAQKFNVPGTSCIPDAECIAFGVMIAGDGYAYLGYEWSEFPNPELLYPFVRHLMVLRVDSSGDYQNIDVSDYTSGGLDFAPLFPYMITNADQGILLTWNNGGKGMATITGGSLSPVSSPLGSQFVPVLQAQDGSFVGITGQDCSVGYGGMVSFDAAGNVRWIVPNDCPQIATADGGVIGQSGITYDQNGNATGMVGSLPTYSWRGNAYQDGPVTQVAAATVDFALSFNAFLDGSPSANGTAAKVVMSPMFIPYSLTDFPSEDFSIIFALEAKLDPTKIALYPLLLGDAKASTFKNYLARTNVIVGYIDHGMILQGQANALGLCFAGVCLSPAALGEQYQPQAPGLQMEYLPNGFQPKAKAVMLAICGADEAFIGQWHLPPTGQALIVPVYSPGNTGLHLSLGWAAVEWQAMLLALAKGDNVQAAVAAGNAKAQAIPQTEHTWQVIGDPLVTFHAQSH